MFKNVKKNSQGFTIIEVLIVLAIAGLIMMVVFLAVPALQRNSRNTRRRSDVSNYLSAVNEWVANKDGALPATGDVTAVNALTKFGLLTPPTAVVSGARTIVANPVSIDTLEVVTKAKCDPAAAKIGETLGGSTRQFAVRFAVEDAGGNPTHQCQDG